MEEKPTIKDGRYKLPTADWKGTLVDFDFEFDNMLKTKREADGTIIEALERDYVMCRVRATVKNEDGSIFKIDVREFRDRGSPRGDMVEVTEG